MPVSLRFLSLLAVLALAMPSMARAAGGHAQLQTYFQGSLSNADYQKKVFERVGRAYKQPSAKHAPKPGKKAIVQAVVSQDGKLVSTSVLMESGSKVWDDAALAAVKKAAPFPPLPKDYGAPTVEVHFHLSWVVDK